MKTCAETYDIEITNINDDLKSNNQIVLHKIPIQNNRCINNKLPTILKNFNNIQNKFKLIECMTTNTIFITIIKTRLYFFQLNSDKIYLINRSLKIIKVIYIKKFKTISLKSKFNIDIKFFSDDEVEIIPTRFLSKKDKESLVNEILPNSKKNLNIAYNRKLFLKIFKKRSVYHLLMIRMRKKAEKHNHLYFSEVYNLLQHKVSFKQILFFVFNSSFINKVIKITFFDFNRINLKFKYNATLKNNYIHDMLDKEISFKKSNSKFQTKNKEIDIKMKEEFEHPLRQRKLKNHPHSNCSFNIKSFAEKLIKPVYNKICFNVYLIKYFGKEQKVIEITNDDCFSIYKLGKPEINSTHLISDIIKMEGDSSSLLLNVTINVKELKKIYYLEFMNYYDKYLFKTIVHNHLILCLEKIKKGNQLKLNVHIMTWNIAGIDVPSDLWILFNTNSLQDVDIFTIGVQECGIFKIKDWQKHLKNAIGYYGYADIASIEMCQMFILVFIKREYLPFIDSVETSYKPMGFAKVIGNKGGIIISFKFMGYHLVFVNCHFAPKPYKVLERNKHAKLLVKSIKVGDKFADFDVLADYIFWQGDLNYRVDYNFDQTIEEIKNNNLQLLLAKDQLIRQKQQNQVFYNYQEPEIRFYPTYRRVKGTDEYSNKKNQSPSWCDRIMVKTNRDIDLHYYDSISNVKHSDHLPVLAKFSIYLTTPTFDDIEKSMVRNVSGRLIFTNIKVEYDFTDCFSELELEPRFPLRLKLSSFYFINKNISDSKFIEIRSLEQFEKISFEEMYVGCPPQCIFDLPHARAINIFFILTLVMNKYNYEIGFAKYSLENIERDGLNLLNHSNELEIIWRTRKFGTIKFDANYKL